MENKGHDKKQAKNSNKCEDKKLCIDVAIPKYTLSIPGPNFTKNFETLSLWIFPFKMCSAGCTRLKN